LRVTVVDSLPRIAREADDLPNRAEDAKNRTKPEFDNLGGLDKIEAAAHLAENLRTLEKVSPFIKTAIANFQAFYEEMVTMI
jgi:hypothetical protein